MVEWWQRRRAPLAWWALAGSVAVALKLQFSAAAASDLQWMLHPLALLLHALVGWSFLRDAAGNWVGPAVGLVLVKACAGVNFMLLSFLGWCWLWRPRVRDAWAQQRARDAACKSHFQKRHEPIHGGSGRAIHGADGFENGICSPRPVPAKCYAYVRPWAPWPLRFGAALGCGWLAALGVNALRILLVVRCQPALEHWLAPGDAHRMIGLLTYLPALCLQWSLVERGAPGRGVLLAGGAYAALMLGIPLASGGAAADFRHFATHVAWVLAVLAPLLAFGLWRRNCRTRRFSGS